MRRTVVVVVVVVALATLLAAAWPAWAQPDQALAGQEARVDFNGDGFDDLAVGAPGEAIGSLDGAGAVNVLYGSAAGLVASPEVFIQGSNGVGGTADQNDTFGRAIAQGLFNDDEFFDLAVGSPGESDGGASAGGAVNILYGSAGGLTGGPQLFQSNPETNDRFGESLAAGDFNGDGFFDLAVGAPGEDIGTTGDAGAVTVLFGSAAGITTGAQTILQGSGGITGSAEALDQFGASLASGLLAGDDIADLVVGVPGEDLGGVGEAGAVNVLAGSAGGLVNGSLATQSNPEPSDAFGTAVATGDFDQVAGDDVAVGAPDETVNGRRSAGAVSVFNGPPGGLAAERLLFQGTAGIPGTPELGRPVRRGAGADRQQRHRPVGPGRRCPLRGRRARRRHRGGQPAGRVDHRPERWQPSAAGHPRGLRLLRVGFGRRVLPARLRQQRLLRRRGRCSPGRCGNRGGRRGGHGVQRLRRRHPHSRVANHPGRRRARWRRRELRPVRDRAGVAEGRGTGEGGLSPRAGGPGWGSLVG